MSAKTVFISYRRDAVGKAFSRSLKNALQSHGYDVFLDVDCMDAGAWANQILTEVPKRAHFLLLLTPGALDRCADADDWVRREFELAQTSRRNIVPVREESVDPAEMARNCPDCMRAVFALQIADLRHSSFDGDIAVLMQRFIPAHMAPSTAPTRAPVGFKADISRIDKYAPERLIGREEELAVLDAAWEQAVQGEPERPRILTFVALGGEGKTSLVAKWAAKLAHGDWPGWEAALAWSFYSQGTRDQAAASSDTFFKEALTFFGDPAMADSAASVFDKGRRLARLVGERRALLILDGLEPLQYAPGSPTPGELKDQGLAALLKGLAAANKGLCVVTTRYSIRDLRAYWQTGAPERPLLRLATEAGVALLDDLGVKGSRPEFEKLVEDVDGHALTLQIMGGFLKKAFHGDIRCRDRVLLEKADARVQGGHAFRAMAAYESWLQDHSDEARRELAILRLMGLFDRPATTDCLSALMKEPPIPGLTEPLVGIAEEDWNFSLDALESARLLTVHRDAAGALHCVDAHPLLREYFAGQLGKNHPEAFHARIPFLWFHSLLRRFSKDHTDAFGAAHRRLFEHLCATTKEGDQPTLESLQPLYQAVAHGCRAGLQQEACERVYRHRILRGTGSDGFYSAYKLGAFGSDLGAVACFFEVPWRRVSPSFTPSAQSWLLNEAASRLSGLGRLTEALDPMRAGLEMAVQQEEWKNAAISAANLSELELTLGEVAWAVADGEQSVAHADRDGDAFQRMHGRATRADALHQAGRRAEAMELFREAEQMQAEFQPDYPLLYSLPGCRYCDLLLAQAEREAGKAGGGSDREALSAVCSQVSQRAAQTLKWAEQHLGLLDIALDHLTLGRAALYGAILEQADLRLPVADLAHIDHAVAGLRRAGQQQYLPCGLLARAWLRRLTGRPTGPESAQSDLDEAWEIAQRGPMPLFMADIHLFRARLFFRQAAYPWESPRADLNVVDLSPSVRAGIKPAPTSIVSSGRRGGVHPRPPSWDESTKSTALRAGLAEARRLIEKHGYWRRKEELEDAEAAILP